MTPTAVEVLLVEDDPDLRLVTRALLAKRGFRVRVAGDGNDAAAAMLSSRPDIVIADIELPGMSGIALLAWMRGTPSLSGVPVILLSGQGWEQGVDQAHFLMKPYALEELVALVGTALAVPRPLPAPPH